MTADASAALAVREKVQTFLESARTGNLDLLKKVAMQLDGGKGLNCTVADVKDAYNRTALHFAAREGKIDVCKYILEELNLDVDVQDDDDETPLIHASRQGHFTTAKYLVDSGADPSASTKMGVTPLHHAAGIGQIELLNFLLSKGVNVDAESDAGTPLNWAAGHGQDEATIILLENHANPNSVTDDNVTPLLSAVASGSLSCLKHLIHAGANVNMTSSGGATPLHIAADIGDTKIIECLLEAKADPNILDEEGLKPVQNAALNSNRAVVEILLPLTCPIEGVPDWTVDGLLNFMQSTEEGTRVDSVPAQLEVPKPEAVKITAEAKSKSLEAKSRGDDAFRRKDFLDAVDAYTQAIAFDPSEAIFFSNRSLCWIRLGQAEQALSDARVCRNLRPDWAKACYREGVALRLLQKFEEAASVFYEGVQRDPENQELVDAFREAVEAGRKYHGTNKKP